jgi:peptide/nickel transport system substrate-binding protein
LFVLVIFLALTLTACREDGAPGPTVPAGTAAAVTAGTPVPDSATTATVAPTQRPQPTATITPTPRPPKDLVVCLGSEPADLFLYGDGSTEATTIRHALYESLVTSLGYDYQALALEKLPTLADGDARIETVTVNVGDLIVTAAGDVAPLGVGMELIDATGQTVIASGEPIQMPQLVVDFTLKPLVWSDGQTVTAEDSVFSYRVAADRNTPQVDERVRFTAAYETTGERAVRWTGVPGYLDPTYATHVWTPLPSHQLAEFAPAELPALEESARTPLSYGPFVVDSWTAGESLRLVPNPYYYRAAEGLPHLTSLTFRFVDRDDAPLSQVSEGCHILSNGLLSYDDLPAVDEAAGTGTLVEHVVTTGIVEQIIFGIDSAADYDESHPRWFSDPRVRQAITLCTNRAAIVEEATSGRAQVMDSYISPDHRLHPDDLAQWPHDPAAGNALLDEVGFVDATGDGIRDNIAATTPFSITLGTNAEGDLRMQINERVRDDLAECGILVNPYTLEAGAWFASGPAGAVFGRQFDLATFAWRIHLHPDCGLYLTENIPGPLDGGFNGWDGVNVSGWSNEAYDAACRAALALLPDQPGYVEAHQEALRIFAQELPAMPLFTRLRLAATTPDVLNFRFDPTQPSELWNPFELDLELDGSGS